MYLKKVEIQGFKSFADKTILEVKPGVTIVIGPNGSGKSNISDAIRWVLGEQSAKSLRGGKMDDVIFAGTSARKPLNFAEVSLTMDNSDSKLNIDFAEVVVTRRVYRSGESEFFINKSPCRLKDIIELFMDTGIGKDGYSIIGQGRIDEILSNNSEERRNVFEEAAGISKYKARKNEAEKKLESTKQNLLRITDILNELQSKIEPLEKQSEKAQKFLKLRDELKIFEINNFIIATKKLEENIDTINKHISELTEELNLKSTDVENNIKAQEKAKNDLTNLNISIDDIKNSIFNEQTSIEHLSSEVSILNEKIQNNTNNISNFELENDEFNNKKELLEKEKAEKNKKIDYLNSQKINYVTTLNEKENELSKILSTLSTEEQKIEDIKSEIIEIMNNIGNKKSKLASLNAMLANAISRKEQIVTEENNLLYSSDKLNIYLEDINDTISSLTSKCTKIKEQINDINTKNAEINDLINNLKKENYSLESELNIKKSRHKFLSDTERDNEGYFKSVKSILDECAKNKDFSKGIHGTLAKLITVPEKLETAIEIALSASLQNIITDTQEDAKKAINFLKTNHAGRATFMPLSSIHSKDSSFKSTFDKFDGFIGIANELLSFDPIYKEIIASLLSKTIIVETLDNAIYISKNVTGNFKIVSLEGDIVNTGGTMSGGSIKAKTDGLLSRGRNILELESEIKEINEKIKLNTDKLMEFTGQIDSTATTITSLTEDLKNNEISIATAREKSSSYTASIEENTKKKEAFAIEKKQLQMQQETINSEISTLSYQISELETQTQNYQSQVDEYKKRNREQMEIRDNLNTDITDYKISISSFDESIASITEIIERIDNEFAIANTSLSKRSAQKEKLLAENEKFTLKIDELNKSIENIKVTIESTNNNLENMLDNRINLQEQINSLEKQNLDFNNLVSEVKEKISKAEIKKAKFDIDFENLNNKIWEDYQMTYEDCLTLEQDLGNINISQKINSLKNQIKDLGSINIDAIDEYRETKERFDFMTSQKKDLDDSEEKLKKVILDMTNIMKEEFLRNFSIINKNFGQVFSELFGGGQAILKLADTENILTSGIDIEVQPPGKKLQNMMLLSGGERAFTAIALLFAILKINPSPFCFLDEIEAALDDVNVYRFADYIKKFSNEIQFIIITHRKGTMEAANSIYGVTMEERGVSKLISMQLTN